VARVAIQLEESVQTALFCLTQSVDIAIQEVIETARRYQGTFEGRDGFGNVLVGNGWFVVSKDRGKGLPVLIERANFLHHRVFVGHTHLDRVEDRLLGLLDQVFGASVPELADLPAGIEHGRAVAGADLVSGPGGSRQVIDPGETIVEAVAGGTGLAIVDRQALFKEELLTQLDTFRGISIRTRHGLGQGFKKSVGAPHQQIGIARNHNSSRQQQQCGDIPENKFHGYPARLHLKNVRLYLHGQKIRPCLTA
jgi:hypothetical protein